jgi:hypothetical protein
MEKRYIPSPERLFGLTRSPLWNIDEKSKHIAIVEEIFH